VTPERRRALAVAGLSFALAAPAAYVLQRVYERANGGIPNPTLVLREAHTAYYWRLTTATWWGGLVALVAAAWILRRPTASDTLAARIAWWTFPLLPALLASAYLYP